MRVSVALFLLAALPCAAQPPARNAQVDVMDAESAAPGANDDASGVALAMELACVMALHRFDATLIFLAVAGEEQGLYGSTHFAEQAKQKGLDIAGMISNDIVGSPTGPDGQA